MVKRVGSAAEAGRRVLLACLVTSAALLGLLSVSCGSQPEPTASSIAVGCGTAPPMMGFGTASGVVAALVLREPFPLSYAYTLADELLGEPVAAYRADYGCARADRGGADDGSHVPSRFSYLDAFRIQERALSEGLRTPIADLGAARASWAHWQDQWRHAQEPGVRFEAVAIYIDEATLATARNDPRFRAIEVLPYRRLDGGNCGPYVLLDSEDLPPGTLTEPPRAECGSLPSGEAELDASVSDLKAAAPEADWAELMRGPTQLGPRKVVGFLTEEMIGQLPNSLPAPPSGGFVLYVDGDPKHKLLCYFNFDLQGEDPRYQNLWNRAGGGVQSLGLHRGTLAVYGDPSPGPGLTSADEPEFLAPGEEVVQSFHVLYMEYE